MSLTGESFLTLHTSVTFTGGGTGAAGTSTVLFTTTGGVFVLAIMAHVRTTLTESAGTPTLALGVINGTSDFIAATTATDLSAGELWVDTSPDADSVALPAAMKDILIQENIACLVGGTNNIDAGVIDFTVLYVPIGSASGLAL